MPISLLMMSKRLSFAISLFSFLCVWCLAYFAWWVGGFCVVCIRVGITLFNRKKRVITYHGSKIKLEALSSIISSLIRVELLLFPRFNVLLSASISSVLAIQLHAQAPGKQDGDDIHPPMQC